MTVTLDKRDWRVTIGDQLFRAGTSSALHIDFDIEKSTKREPNKAVFRVYNLSEQRSQAITTETQVALEAGYQGLMDLLYTGEADHVSNQLQGVDRVLTIESQDAGRKYRTTRISKTWGAGTSYQSVLEEVVSAMGLGAGNLSLVVGTFEREEGPRTFPEGFTATGPAWRTLDQLARSAGFRWSVQNGVLQMRRGNRPVDTRVLELTPRSGLIGSPKKDADGKVQAHALLIPGLVPGRVVVLDSRVVSGGYQIKRVRYSGATYSDRWDCTLYMEDY